MLFWKTIQHLHNLDNLDILGNLDNLENLDNLGNLDNLENLEFLHHLQNLQNLHHLPSPSKKIEAPKTFVLGASVKEGGYLLSRIALQYHRRWRA